MYFDIKGSSVRLGGTMHCVPRGRPLAHWVYDAISRARLIYLEHDKEESDQSRFAPPGSQPIARRLPNSWPRIQRKYPFDRSEERRVGKECSLWRQDKTDGERRNS